MTVSTVGPSTGNRITSAHPSASAPSTNWRAAFGPFLLSPDERLLQRNGMPIRLGGRALDLLIVLVDNAGSVLSKKELLARVWGDVVVDEGSVRFHMHAVRNALGDGEGGSRYIVNTANKGYTFVASIERRALAAGAATGAESTLKALPALSAAIVGRDNDIASIVASLQRRRLMTIVGSGGIGKTTVSIAAAQTAADAFNRDVTFVDFSKISDMGLVRSTVAGAFGLQNGLDDPAALTAHLADRRALIVMDCCEHVISGAAELAEYLVRSCPSVHILATSREPLRAEGEYVFRLQPLAYPPEGEGTTAEDALTYPAVRLFVDRAAASSGFELKDSDALLASRLCRELDGIALAIELAAGRIEALGLKVITSHLDASIKLMWHGRRTAVPRHQTLGATLDWSFNLLAEDEKRMLRRLAVFAGQFSLDAAVAVCGHDCDRSMAIELIAGLVSKSLVNVDAGGTSLRYGMLDTTKSYCWKRLTACGEDAVVTTKFANYFAAWAHEHAARPPADDIIEAVASELPNLRAALEWYFRDGLQAAEAIQFAASFCPLLLQLSRLAECSRWAQTALSQMPAEFIGSRFEVQLQGALGQSLMFTGGDGNVAVKAFRRSIEIAEEQKDHRTALHLLNGYAVLLHRDGRYTDALTVARKGQDSLPQLDDLESRAIVDSLMGVSLHLVGHVDEAMGYFQRSSAFGASTTTDTTSRLGFNHHIRALCGIARTLWLTGHYARAVEVAEDTISKAAGYGHAVTHCIALVWAGSVFVYAGDVQRLQWIVETLEDIAKRHSLMPYLSVASVTRGQMLIARGHAAEGVERIRSAIQVLHACRYEMVTTVSLTIMAKGLSDLSLHAAAVATCDEVEALIRAGGDFLRMPELLTTKGRVLAAAGALNQAAKSWLAAIGLARAQGVKSVQVRAAVALAQQLISTGRHDEAEQLLRPHVIAAGNETSPDLSAARSLLQ